MSKHLWLFLLTFVVFFSPAVVQDKPAFTEKLRIGRGAVLDAEWHPNGQLILVDTIIGAWLYDAWLTDVAHLPDARLGTFSPDGSLIAGIDAHNDLTLWEAAPPFAQVASLPGHNRTVSAVEWSPDGTRLASLDRDGVLLIWEAATRQVLHRLQMDGADEIAWSRGGSYLAATNGNTVQVWDRKGELTFSSQTEYNPVIALIWRNETQLLYLLYESGGFDIQLWDVKTQKMIFEHGVGTAYDPNYNSDGSLLALSSTGLWIVDANTGELKVSLDLYPFGKDTDVTAWSPDDTYVAFGERSWEGFDSGGIWVMDIRTGEIVSEFSGHNRDITGIYWNPDGTRLLTVDKSQELLLWDTQKYDNRYSIASSLVHTDIGRTAAWDYNGTLLAVGDTYFGLRIWDAATGEERISRMPMPRPATKVVWQPGGRLVASASGDGWNSADDNIYIWDGAQDNDYSVPITTIPHTSAIADMAWSPDGIMLASAEINHTIRLWNSVQRNNVRSFSTLLSDYLGVYVQDVGWSPTGNLIVFKYFSGAGGPSGTGLLNPTDDTIREGGLRNWVSDWIWTSQSGFMWAGSSETESCDDTPAPNEITLLRKDNATAEAQKLCLTGLVQAAREIRFSPDAKMLAVYVHTDYDVGGQAIVWDLRTGKERQEFEHVSQLNWSSDSVYLIIKNADDTVKIIEISTGKQVASFDVGFDFNVAQVVWSPDSQQFALLDQGVMFIYERNE